MQKMNVKYSLIALSLLLSLWSCQDKGIMLPVNPPEPEPLYSFFIAGHVYGKPHVDNPGVHPPFKAKFPMIREDATMEMGFFTGDMVYLPSEEDWDEVDADAALLEMPVHYVAGNHDMWNRTLYESRYGSPYYTFSHREDLFIVLDGNGNGWNIKDEQLDFFSQTLDSLADQSNRVFIFSHQLLWWAPDNIFRRMRPNSFNGRGDSTNFWTVVEPMLQDLNKEVFWFGGDIGAIKGWNSYSYYQYDQITLAASGMGGGEADNFVIVDVWADKPVSFRLIALNGEDIDALGKLEDYVLPQ